MSLDIRPTGADYLFRLWANHRFKRTLHGTTGSWKVRNQHVGLLPDRLHAWPLIFERHSLDIRFTNGQHVEPRHTPCHRAALFYLHVNSICLIYDYCVVTIRRPISWYRNRTYISDINAYIISLLVSDVYKMTRVHLQQSQKSMYYSETSEYATWDYSYCQRRNAYCIIIGQIHIGLIMVAKIILLIKRHVACEMSLEYLHRPLRSFHISLWNGERLNSRKDYRLGLCAYMLGVV